MDTSPEIYIFKLGVEVMDTFSSFYDHSDDNNIPYE
jgi:hypothetical protein